MLPMPHVTQSQCLSSEAFDASKFFATSHGKYRKRVTSNSQKLDLKQRRVFGQLMKPFRRISCNHHVLKALATSDVSVVETSENVATYRFRMETGGQLKVLVKKKNNNKHVLYVEVESLQLLGGQRELFLVWGLFRDHATTFMPLGFQKSSADDNTIETPFMKDSSDRFAVEVDFDENLPPFYVSFLLKSQCGSDLKISTIRSHRKTNFIVPVGFGSGRPFPLGISFLDDGSTNFAFFSQNAESVVLCLYSDTTVDEPALEIDLDPYVNRTGDIWHASVDCSPHFVSYGYRCRSGPDNKGHNVLLDPYAKVIEDIGLDLPQRYLGKLFKEPPFDWSGEFCPSIPMEKLIIYRLNVTRFTRHNSSKLPGDIAGSFSGVSEKLHHFKDLGVNAVLLEPIFPFDEKKRPYFPAHFFSPGNLYGPSGNPNSVAKSMKEMVKKLHASGIEVLLEVVFTHTGETGSLREIDNSCYYHIKGGEDLKLGNALNCNYPIVQQMILESLRYWVTEFHIDGFCFINASSLTRGFHGEFLSRPPLVEAIAFDPLLSKVKIIADSWDPHDMETKEIAFPHWKRWAEMNARFCVDVRNFLRGKGPINNLATRLCGSGDLFLSGRGPAFSFNFITRNVGLTLVDLVSFSNSDLESELSWNCGEEGPTNKSVVLERRLKQIRNFLFILFISLGVPVLNMGDECGQSSGGSTAYADRKLLDWNALKSGFGIQVTQFISFLSSLRIRRSDLLQKRSFLKEDNIEWHGTQQSPPTWDDPSCKFLAMTLKAEAPPLSSPNVIGGDLFIAFNSADHSAKVAVPPLASVDATWVRLVDTALPLPGFFSKDGVPLDAGLVTYEMKSHSCILFEARSS
ncbi:1,4-alpha-glucan branching enzyme/starch branching enzyme II [Handroanthus impetiginosus]|uniref:1,4-alpha-glucan branching enzyme/starch branching enzyme II n=1 Tax=Handroanthus impetiginosus TaxID=429701 RepID=A0A2G9FXH7_9LAMI|nr:1,4-alpha-glucan branching enzyme/starch branching enzyme II [Handroanthus impetiginosus]